MEENKKKGKGLKIVLVIFIILFLLTAGALGYGYTKYKELKNENTNLNTKYENENKNLEKTKSELDLANNKLSTSEKNYIEIDGISFSNQPSYNLYSISENTAVVGFDGKIYYFDHAGIYDTCVNVLLLEKPNFKNGKALCKYKDADVDEDDMIEYIYETDIREKDLYKAISTFNPANTGYNYEIFFIMKDGSVRLESSTDFKLGNELDKYKIKDIKKFYCSSGAKDTCKGPLKLDVILQDGSEKTIKLD